MLVIDDLRVEFGGVVALAGISFRVQPGTITSLIGPNGAGKTTAFNAITGYLRASRGRVVWDGDVTVLVVEHDMRLVMGLSETVIVLNHGRVIAEGVPAEIRAHPEVVRAYLGSADAPA